MNMQKCCIWNLHQNLPATGIQCLQGDCFTSRSFSDVFYLERYEGKFTLRGIYSTLRDTRENLP